MNAAPNTNDEQTILWNGTAGHGWIAARAALDQMFKPFEDLMVEAASRVPGGRVLDIGCGTGSTTRAMARAAKSDCLGVDISFAMIAAAQARAEPDGVSARFVCADAETYAFAPASFDLLLSRFGVMFFGDPIRAFGNLRRAARNGAKLRVFAWRGPEENSFMTLAERAAAPLLPDLLSRRSARPPDAPGPFAFADPERVRAILQESGWTGIDIQTLDVDCAFPESELVQYLTWMGPIGRILQESDASTRAKVIEPVRAAFDPYVHGSEVRFTAACWMVSAHV